MLDKTTKPMDGGVSPLDAVTGLHGGNIGAALAAIFAAKPGGVPFGDGLAGGGAAPSATGAPPRGPETNATPVHPRLDPFGGAAPEPADPDGTNPAAPWILTDGSEHETAIASPFGGSGRGPIRDGSWVGEEAGTAEAPYDCEKDADGGVTYGPGYDGSNCPIDGKDGGGKDGGTGGGKDGGTSGGAGGGKPDGGAGRTDGGDADGGVKTPEPPSGGGKDGGTVVVTLGEPKIVAREPAGGAGGGKPDGGTKTTTGEDGGGIAAPDILGLVRGLLDGGGAIAGSLDAGLGERLPAGNGAKADAFVFRFTGQGVGDGGLGAPGDLDALDAALGALREALHAAVATAGDLDGLAVLAVAEGEAVSWAAVDLDDWL
jgi:hypothetical protein